MSRKNYASVCPRKQKGKETVDGVSVREAGKFQRGKVERTFCKGDETDDPPRDVTVTDIKKRK